MNNSRFIIPIILVLSLMAMQGCVPAPPGMDVYALQTHQVTPFYSTRIALGFHSIHGQWVSDIGYNSNAQNLGTDFILTLDGAGRGHVANTRLPAVWDFTFLNTRCVDTTIREPVEMHTAYDGFALLLCQRIEGIHPFSFTPATADAQAMPASFASSGDGIDVTYGMPRVDFYDEYGRLTASTFVTSVGTDAAGSTWLTGDLPSLPYSCTYTVAVNNVLSDGSFDFVGATMVIVINGQELPPLPDPPPDPNPTPDPCGPNPCLIY